MSFGHASFLSPEVFTSCCSGLLARRRQGRSVTKRNRNKLILSLPQLSFSPQPRPFSSSSTSLNPRVSLSKMLALATLAVPFVAGLLGVAQGAFLFASPFFAPLLLRSFLELTRLSLPPSIGPSAQNTILVNSPVSRSLFCWRRRKRGGGVDAT